MVIFFKKSRQHVNDIDEVRTLLLQTGVILELAKCHFLLKKIKRVGQILMPCCLAVASKNFFVVKTAVFPIDSTQIRSFLSVCNS